MEIKDCPKCHGQMRLRGARMSVNRKRAVAHWIEHKRGEIGGCDGAAGYSCAMVKPYPKADSDKPWFQMIERWNAAQ